jgi:hypothetical protein
VAIAFVRGARTGAGATSTLTITSPAAGNTLNVFIAQSGTTSAPTLKDNLGTSGWTVNEVKALGNTSAGSLWFATKEAVGTETKLEPTVGTGGTLNGIGYAELSGASQTVDAITHQDNGATATTQTSVGITTTDAGDILLGFVGDVAATNTGTVSAWTGTGPMTNISTGTSRAGVGGWYLPEKTLTAAAFTANWETGIKPAMLVVAIKPAGGAGHAVTCGDTITVSDSASASSAHARTAGDTVTVSESAGATSAHARTCGDTVTVSDAAAGAATKSRTAADTVSVSDSASCSAQSFARTAADTVTISESVTRTSVRARTCGDTVTVSDAATRAAHATRTAGDTLTFSDSASQLGNRARTASDTITVSDAASVETGGAISVGPIVIELRSTRGIDIELESAKQIDFSLEST